jgi:hypothetical protein
VSPCAMGDQEVVIYTRKRRPRGCGGHLMVTVLRLGLDHKHVLAETVGRMAQNSSLSEDGMYRAGCLFLCGPGLHPGER